MYEDFEQVYEEYYSTIFKYLITITKSPDMAEEITQETFYKALKNIDKYNPEKKMLTWLCTIAKNTCYTEIKRQQKHKEFDEILVDESDIVDRILDYEDSSRLLKIVHHLEEPYKEVFTLRTFAELPFRQIAELFGRTESWARVTFYRSKSKIKEKMDNDKV